jgi:hypothetical protein
MATKNLQLNWYLGSVYFYLHFQYNGWFFFACFGLFFYQLQHFLPTITYHRNIFRLFFFSCIPAFLLSILWANLPGWIYIFAVLGALVQCIGWIAFIKFIRPLIPQLRKKIPLFVQGLFLILSLTITVKFLLQLGSTIPIVSKLAFGFRPIVIAYLHLVLLLIISVFLISFLLVTNHIANSKLTRFALLFFVVGILANEFLLALQGIMSFSYVVVPYINELLFGVSLCILFGLLLLFISSLQKAPVL